MHEKLKRMQIEGPAHVIAAGEGGSGGRAVVAVKHSSISLVSKLKCTVTLAGHPRTSVKRNNG